MVGAEVTTCVGDDTQGGSGVNTQVNTQSPDIANKLDQMTSLLDQLGPALTGITQLAKAAADRAAEEAANIPTQAQCKGKSSANSSKGKAAIKRTYYEISYEEVTEDDEENEAIKYRVINQMSRTLNL